jgi:hypothetical protein
LLLQHGNPGLERAILDENRRALKQLLEYLKAEAAKPNS